MQLLISFAPSIIYKSLILMIQRIQSIYLTAVFLISVFLYFLPVSAHLANETTNGVYYKMDMFSIYKIEGSVQTVVQPVSFNAAFNGVMGLIALVCLFQFKKRPLQLKLCNVLMLLGICFFALLFYETDRMIPGDAGNYKTIYLPGIYLAVVQVVFVFLAKQAIKKDDALVRSVDRIR
jgi:Domain of unknown function (DUF4293)